MVNSNRHSTYKRHKNRIQHLFKSFESHESIELKADNAKYLAVLTSGYLEQALKELFLIHTTNSARETVTRYVEQTWPISKNMNTKNIEDILGKFNSLWKDRFQKWLEEDDERKSNINSLVSWRNSIAHGQESNTTGVTLVSVKRAFETVDRLVNFVESDMTST